MLAILLNEKFTMDSFLCVIIEELFPDMCYHVAAKKGNRIYDGHGRTTMAALRGIRDDDEPRIRPQIEELHATKDMYPFLLKSTEPTIEMRDDGTLVDPNSVLPSVGATHQTEEQQVASVQKNWRNLKKISNPSVAVQKAALDASDGRALTLIPEPCLEIQLYVYERYFSEFCAGMDGKHYHPELLKRMPASRIHFWGYRGAPTPNAVTLKNREVAASIPRLTAARQICTQLNDNMQQTEGYITLPSGEVHHWVIDFDKAAADRLDRDSKFAYFRDMENAIGWGDISGPNHPPLRGRIQGPPWKLKVDGIDMAFDRKTATVTPIKAEETEAASNKTREAQIREGDKTASIVRRPVGFTYLNTLTKMTS